MRAEPHELALYVAQTLPPEPAPSRTIALRLPLPAHPDPRIEFIHHTLWTPGWHRPRCEVAPRGVERGIQRPWAIDVFTGLSMPSDVASRWKLDRFTRAKALLAPDQIGIPFDPDVTAPLAWAVQRKFPPGAVAQAAATLAVRAEVRGALLTPEVVTTMQFGGPINSRLKTLAASGEVVVSPDCLRWIVREVAAAVAAGSWAEAGDAPTTKESAYYAARVLFPCLHADVRPTLGELIRAVWVLHQSFRFGDANVGNTSAQDALSMITAMSSGQPQWGSWVTRLERWKVMFAAGDADPALTNVGILPSAFRALFNAEVGVTVDEWLTLAMFLVTKYMWCAQNTRPFDTDLGSLIASGLSVPFTPRCEAALRTRAVADLQTVGHAVLDEIGTYEGLGSLPAVEGQALRATPLIETAPSIIVPVSLHMLTDRAIVVPRHEIGQSTAKAGRVGSLLGKLFEIQVRDVAIKARPRHGVITGDQIDAMVPKRKGKAPSRCDAIVVDGDRWLFIEAGMQTLPPSIGSGYVPDIQRSCEHYHKKADQAEATLKHGASLAKKLGYIPPKRTTLLVVADVPVPMTVPLVDELRRQRPTRSPLFVAGIEEFRRLIAAGSHVSIPGVVEGWQRQGDPVSLLVALHELSSFIPFQGPGPALDAASWVESLGSNEAA